MSLGKDSSERWAALDAVKTAAVLVTLLSHIVIWWYGENQGSGNSRYRLDIPQSVAISLLSFVIVLITASGAIFYFHLKRLTSFPALAGRAAVFLAVGFFLGLNLKPFGILWNIFGFYAVSIVLMALMKKYGGATAMIAGTASCFLLTPVLRHLLGESADHSYLAAVLVGDPEGRLSYFPVFPWFSVLGAGFLTGDLYERSKGAGKEKAFRRAALAVGSLILIGLLPFLPPLDLSNAFGTTSRISILYPLCFGGAFLIAIALFDGLLRNATLSAYHPINAIGRHLLAVYLTTLLTMLAATSALKSAGAFLTLNALTLAVAYATGCLLERWRLRRARGLSAV